jgi:flagellar biosynthesis protein FliQ
LTNLRNRFDLENSLFLSSFYSEKKKLVFSHVNFSTTFTDTTSFLVPKALQRYTLTSIPSIDRVETTVATIKQIPFQVDLITLIQRLTQSFEVSISYLNKIVEFLLNLYFLYILLYNYLFVEVTRFYFNLYIVFLTITLL